MLGDYNIGPAVAVKDLEAAKKFYGETLGLSLDSELPGGGGLYYKSGDSLLLVYPSEYAGTNKATYAGWNVDDIEAVVADLKSKGLTFEHYPDLPGITLEDDIHSWNGEGKTVWFKDPDGNIFAISQM